MDGQHAIEFFILDREAKIAGYTWLIEWSTTSFYINSLYKPMQMTEVSLHGPDSKHIDEQHFRLDSEHPSQAVKAVNAGRGQQMRSTCRCTLRGGRSTSAHCTYFDSRRSGKCS
jgi:hypothetical protein